MKVWEVHSVEEGESLRDKLNELSGAGWTIFQVMNEKRRFIVVCFKESTNASWL